MPSPAHLDEILWLVRAERAQVAHGDRGLLGRIELKALSCRGLGFGVPALIASLTSDERHELHVSAMHRHSALECATPTWESERARVEVHRRLCRELLDMLGRVAA